MGVGILESVALCLSINAVQSMMCQLTSNLGARLHMVASQTNGHK
jgi:hypothetical protein